MKRILALLLSLIMIFSMTACGSKQVADPAQPAATEGNAANAPADAEAAVEATPSSDPLKLMWFQAIGIDTMFECPWWDMQNLGPFMVFESLVAQEGDGSTMTGILASDWSVSDDGLTYTFTIRDGVTWHDGEPFTTYDVAWSLSTIAQSSTSVISKSALSVIEGVEEAIEAAADDPAATATILSGITYDDTTVSIKIKSVNKMFLTTLGGAKILPAHVYENIPMADMKGLSTYVGTGPYCLNEVSFPDYYTLTAYENYWGEPAGISDVLLTSYDTGGSDAAINAMITGELDFVYGNTMNDISVAKNITTQNPDTTYDIQSSNYNRKMFFNLYGRGDGQDKPDLMKEEVRQAFNLLLDKEAMAGVYAGQAEPLTTFVPTNNPLYNSDIPVFKRDVAAAKALLDSVNFDYSQTYELITDYSDQATADLLAFIKQNFAEAGVQLEVSQLDAGAYTIINGEKNYDLKYASNGEMTNPVQQYEKVCSTFSQDYGRKEERAQMYDVDYYAWLATADEKEARQYSDALQATLVKDCYQIPIYAMNTIVTYNKRVTLPTDMTVYDNRVIRNWHWEDWSLSN